MDLPISTRRSRSRRRTWLVFRGAELALTRRIARRLKNVFFNVTPADNGKFFDYKGDNLPW